MQQPGFEAPKHDVMVAESLASGDAAARCAAEEALSAGGTLEEVEDARRLLGDAHDEQAPQIMTLTSYKQSLFAVNVKTYWQRRVLELEVTWMKFDHE